MKRLNCWEEKSALGNRAGVNTGELGVCPAVLPSRDFDGVNNGRHCGRFCWAIAGTFCKRKV